MAEGGGIRGTGEEVTPVDETAPPPTTIEWSHSVQCTGEDCMDKDTKLFAHGATLFSAENSYPLDSGLKHLSLNEKFDYIRKEFDERIKNLEDSLNTKSQELIAITAEKKALEKKMEVEQQEKTEKIQQLENEKVGLERKIESLEAEVSKLRSELDRFMNQSQGWEEQIQKMQEKKSSTPSTPQIPMAMQQLFEGVCKLFQEHLPPGSEQLSISPLHHAIQKASSMKESYKSNGNSRGSGNNGMPDVCISSQPEELQDVVEDNNTSKSEPTDAADSLADKAEALVESNNS